MSVHKRGDRWIVRWREGDKHRQRTFSTLKEAKRHDQVMSGRDLQGAYAESVPSRMLLGDFMEDWFLAEKVRFSDKTIYNWSAVMGKWIRPYLGDEPLALVAEQRVAEWRAEIIRAGCPVRQANYARTILSAALGKAVEWGMLPRNPVTAVRPIKQPKAKPEGFELEEIEAIRACIARPEDRALVSVLAYCGLRPGEAQQLLWCDIKDSRVLVINHKEPENGWREIPLPSPVSTELEALRGIPDANVFRSQRGFALDWGNWTDDIWRKALKAAKVTYRRPYDMRHLFASLMIAEGRSPVEVAYLMGHSKPSTALDIYAHRFRRAGKVEPLEERLANVRICSQKSSLAAFPNVCSTRISPAKTKKAGDRARTGDPQLGKMSESA